MAKKAGASSGAAAGSASFKVGDIVLGRLRGYPKWPSRVVDPETLPKNVMAARPGKSPSIYCIQFFPAGDYSWLNARDIEPLPAHQVQQFLEESHRKPAGELRKAYETAADPTQWDADQKTALAKRQEVDDEEDELEEEDEEEGAAKTGSKRKAPASKKAAAKKSKPEKVEKPKSKSAPKKAAKQPESKAAQPENQAAAEDDPLASDPVCAKVKDWRHKLQRTFLGKTVPTAGEMPAQDELFKSIEAYTSMSIDALQYSKIGKVMKKICTLDNIPRNDEFKITERARKLMEDWQEMITKHTGENGDEAAPASAGANGDAAASSSAKPASKKPASSAAAKPAEEAPAEESKEEVKEDAKEESKEESKAESKEEAKEAPKEETNGEAPAAVEAA